MRKLCALGIFSGFVNEELVVWPPTPRVRKPIVIPEHVTPDLTRAPAPVYDTVPIERAPVPESWIEAAWKSEALWRARHADEKIVRRQRPPPQEKVLPLANGFHIWT